MAWRSSRRAVLKGGLAAGALGSVAMPHVHAANPERVSNASLATGISVIINDFMAAKRFDLKHGVDLVVTSTFTAVNNYYTDFAAGSFDLAVGSWDVFATLYQRGVPAKLVCSATSANMINVVTGPNGVTEITALRGKSMAAVQATGSFAMCKAVLQDVHKLELGRDIAIQNVPSPAQSITLVAAGNVDAGLSWEPNISIGMAQIRGLKPIFNVGEAYRSTRGEVLPYFAFAARSERLKQSPDLGARLAAAFRDCIDAIMAHPEEAFAISAAKMQVAPAVFLDGFAAKRLDFRADAMTEPAGRKLVTGAFDYLQARGAFEPKKLGDDFFA